MEVVSEPALAKRIMLRMISVGERDFAESSLERRWWITSLLGVDLFARPVFWISLLMVVKKKEEEEEEKEKEQKDIRSKVFSFDFTTCKVLHLATSAGMNALTNKLLNHVSTPATLRMA